MSVKRVDFNNSQFEQQGFKFLYDLEILDDPQLINNLKLNILVVSDRIRDLEILSLHNYGRKEMLVWLNLTWWGNKFYQEDIKVGVKAKILKLLPNFRIRVTCDQSILNSAVGNVTRFFGTRGVS